MDCPTPIQRLACAALLVCALAAAPASAQTGSKPFTAHDGPEGTLKLEQPEPRAYVKPGLRRAGLVLTLLGSVALISGTALIAAHPHCFGDSCDFSTTGGIALAGGSALLFVGIPMWVAGSRRVEPAGAALKLEQPEPQVYAKPHLRRTGIVLTVVGSLALVAGTAVLLHEGAQTYEGECDFCGAGQFLIGTGAASLGGLLLVIGVPLWIAGSRHVDPTGAARLLPRALSLGPMSASARWEF